MIWDSNRPRVFIRDEDLPLHWREFWQKAFFRETPYLHYHEEIKGVLVPKRIFSELQYKCEINLEIIYEEKYKFPFMFGFIEYYLSK